MENPEINTNSFQVLYEPKREIKVKTARTKLQYFP
jgi:hypothetical protein